MKIAIRLLLFFQQSFIQKLVYDKLASFKGFIQIFNVGQLSNVVQSILNCQVFQ